MAEDSGWLGGLLGNFFGGYNPQAAYSGLLSDPETTHAMRIRALAAAGQAFGEGALSQPSGAAIPFGTTLGRAGNAAYTGGMDTLIKARQEAAQTEQELATAGLTRGKLQLLPELAKAYGLLGTVGDGTGETKPSGITPLARLGGGGGGGLWDAAQNVQHTPAELAQMAANAGFRGAQIPTMVATIMGESGGNSQSYNPNDPMGSFGVAQINAKAHGTDVAMASLDPQTALNNAYRISKQGTDFSPWSVYKSGAYKQYLDPALATVVPGGPRQAGGGAQTADVPPAAPGSTAAPPGIAIQYPPGGGQPIDPRTGQPVSPTGEPLAPPAAPGPGAAQALTGLLSQQAAQEASAAPRAPLVPPIPPPAAIAPPAGQGAAADPVTQRTMAALANTRGGADAAPQINGGLLTSLTQGAGAPPGVGAPPGGDIRTALGAAGAPPAAPPVPPLARLAQAIGAPPVAPPAAPAPLPPPPQAQALTGLLAQKAAQEASAAPPVTQGGGLLPQAPVRPPPAAQTPAVPSPPIPGGPPAPAGPPAAPGLPGGVPLPPLPQFTLPTPPQMQNIPIPSLGAGTQKEQIAQKIAGISALVGMPAPAWVQNLANMPTERATELYKAQLLQETNRINELYKTQLAASTAEFMEAAKQRGATPFQIQQELAKQQRYYDPKDGIIKLLPGALEAKGLELQQAADIEVRKSGDITRRQQEAEYGPLSRRQPSVPGQPPAYPEGIDPTKPIPTQRGTIIPPLSSQPEYTSYGALKADLPKATELKNDWATSVSTAAQAEERLLQISRAYKLAQTGSFAERKADLAGALTAVGFDRDRVESMLNTNVTAVQTALHENYKQTLATLAAVNKRFTNSEFTVNANTSNSANIQPEANLNMLSEDLANVRRIKNIASDWNDAQLQVGQNGERWDNPLAFASRWQDHNPYHRDIQVARRDIGDLKGMTSEGGALSPPSRIMHDPQSGYEITVSPGGRQWIWSNGPNAGKPYVPPGGR